MTCEVGDMLLYHATINDALKMNANSRTKDVGLVVKTGPKFISVKWLDYTMKYSVFQFNKMQYENPRFTFKQVKKL